MAFTQLLANSLITGSVYALVAIGFSLIYSTNSFIHFAHGANVVVAAYLLFHLYTAQGLSLSISIILTILVSILVGVAMYRVIYVPLQKRKSSNAILLIASVSLLLILENLILLFFGSTLKTLRVFNRLEGLQVLGAVITPLQIITVLITIVLLLSLYFFLKHTTLGCSMRACADSKELAAIIGINTQKISQYSFAIGSSLAGVAGILLALERSISPNMGTTLMVKGFTSAIIGGIGSIPGAVLGAYLLGTAENVAVWFLSSGFKDAIGFIILFCFLLFKPSGILGIDKGAKND